MTDLAVTTKEYAHVTGATLTSLWSSSLLRPWGSAGEEQTGMDEERKGGEEGRRTNHLVCSRRGHLLDWISLA